MSAHGTAKISVNRPYMNVDEIAILLSLEIPDALFTKPKLVADEVITIYGILCLPSEEAPRMAHVQFPDVQDRPLEFLDLTSLTLDEFQQLVPHSTEFSAGVYSCSPKASGGEDLQVEHPVRCRDVTAFHFDPTLACIQSPALVGDQVVEVRQAGEKRRLAPSGMMDPFMAKSLRSMALCA